MSETFLSFLLKSLREAQDTSKKQKVALSSVLAAVALTSMKLVVGIVTNSLGVLSEALHSAIDLIAAFTTFYAVRIADSPPDSDHMYGHGKVESLASLVETALLFVTCGWILYEAVSRLLFKEVEVDLGLSALFVMGISMIIDFSRSRALMRTAKEYKSQALEADAIHFSTDLISSSVVIIGILATMMGYVAFDSYAGIGVAFVTAFIGYRILKKSVHTLMDGAPYGVIDRIVESAESVDGIRKVGRVRVRECGPKTFVDLDVNVDGDLNLEEAHNLTDSVVDKIKSTVPGADVVVHAEPISKHDLTLTEKIRHEAMLTKDVRSISNIQVSEQGSRIDVEFDIEVEEMELKKAHEVATGLEERIKRLDGRISNVTSHIEPFRNNINSSETAVSMRNELEKSLKEIVARFPEVACTRDLDVKKISGKFAVTFCCLFGKEISLEDAHSIATKIEAELRSKYHAVESVSIHLEPSF
ncbi:MAG: cation diffusion facilitator family transporter [Candidatus Verstraetearchaeota archaeon]|nr:cation diffusion facilitator family transporter [Candidatus Verstraetearchaeota archaeon]